MKLNRLSITKTNLSLKHEPKTSFSIPCITKLTKNTFGRRKKEHEPKSSSQILDFTKFHFFTELARNVSHELTSICTAFWYTLLTGTRTRMLANLTLIRSWAFAYYPRIIIFAPVRKENYLFFARSHVLAPPDAITNNCVTAHYYAVMRFYAPINIYFLIKRLVVVSILFPF